MHFQWIKVNQELLKVEEGRVNETIVGFPSLHVESWTVQVG